ncbi:hypothetical protein QTP70_017099, partial [Hemibagrus guttatus]
KPKVTVRVNPQSSVYTGDTVTLSCELQQGTGWEFHWYKNNQWLQNLKSEQENTLKVTVDNAGEREYQCRAGRRNYYTHYNNNDYYYYYTDLSDPVKITVRVAFCYLVQIKHPNCLSLSPCLLSRNRRSDRYSMDPSSNPPDPLQDLVVALRQALAALPAPAPTPPAITSADSVTASSAPLFSSPMAQPAPYSGLVEDCNGFLLQCSLVLEMQPYLYPTERSKVAFVITQLRGQALLWTESLWSQDSPVTQSYAGFVEHFKEVFGKPSWDLSVGEELCKLRQGKLMVTEYAIQFRTLAAKSGWNEQALLAAYRQGLSPQVRLHLAAHEDASEPR